MELATHRRSFIVDVFCEHLRFLLDGTIPSVPSLLHCTCRASIELSLSVSILILLAIDSYERPMSGCTNGPDQFRFRFYVMEWNDSEQY